MSRAASRTVSLRASSRTSSSTASPGHFAKSAATASCRPTTTLQSRGSSHQAVSSLHGCKQIFFLHVQSFSATSTHSCLFFPLVSGVSSPSARALHKNRRSASTLRCTSGNSICMKTPAVLITLRTRRSTRWNPSWRRIANPPPLSLVFVVLYFKMALHTHHHHHLLSYPYLKRPFGFRPSFRSTFASLLAVCPVRRSPVEENGRKKIYI